MITVIPFCQQDFAQADRLMDLIYWLSKQNPSGHCLLVEAGDIHPELSLKAKISAEVAFETSDVVKVPSTKGMPKVAAVNRMFQMAARYIKDCYKQPWLWLEPDCVVLKPDWRDQLMSAYEQKPRRYMGRHMQAQAGRFMARVGIYPPDASTDLEPHFASAGPFERVAKVSERCANSVLFHNEKWSPGMVIPEPAMILNGDKTGALVEQLIEGTITPEPAKRGRPRKILT